MTRTRSPRTRARGALAVPTALAVLAVAAAPGLSAAAHAAPAVAPAATVAAAPVVETVTAPGETTLTVALNPSDPAGFATLLARTTHVATSSRLAALRAVEPTAGQLATVTRAFTALGFAVTPYGAFAVHATAPTAVATRALGVTLVQDGSFHYPSSQPQAPAAARGLVSVVSGFDTRPKRHPLNRRPAAGAAGVSAYTPTDFRTAYRVVGDGAGTTVATLQLAPWKSADLGTFATLNQLTLATGQFTPISVDGGETEITTAESDPLVDDGAHVEVALDQESVLGQAPKAKQRAYFAPNTDQGFLDVLLRMGADAAANHIVSASSSWGECEKDNPQNVTESNAVTAMTAAGVSFFTSAGDDGAYDCAVDDTTSGMTGPESTTPAVDTAASYPASLGVGGTTLTSTGPPPVESTWSGTGGGQSDIFARPAYQSAITGAPGGRRLVPDLAEDADPNTGALIYDSADLVLFPGASTVGGTSLSSPLAAGSLASALSSISCTQGLGDIHPALYRTRNVNDVTTGRNNGAQSATTGGFAAGPGYDLATGVGTPKWDLLVQDLRVGTPCAAASGTPVTPTLPEVAAPALLVLAGLAGAGGLVTMRRRRAAR